MLSFRRRNRVGSFIYFLVTKEEREVGAHVKHPGLRGLHRPSNHFVYVSSTCLAILLCQFDRKRERDKITIDWPINRRPLSDNRASTAFETNRYLCVISWYYPVHRLRQSSTPVTPLDLDPRLFWLDVSSQWTILVYFIPITLFVISLSTIRWLSYEFRILCAGSGDRFECRWFALQMMYVRF